VPSARIPLFGSMNQRGLNSTTGFTTGGDQRYVNCFLDAVENPTSQTRTIYLQKRQGLETYLTPASGQSGVGVYVSPGTLGVFSVFLSGGVYTLYRGTTSMGVIGGSPTEWSECSFNSIIYTLFTATGDIHYVPSDAVSASTTFTGDTTNASAVVTNVSSTTGLYVGQRISGTGIPPGTGFSTYTRIQSIDSSTQITMTAAATATNATVTITREHVAKVIDSDLPSAVSGVAEMDGRLFVMSSDGIYQSDINSVSSWSASGFIPTNSSTDIGLSLVKSGSYIVGLSSQSIEFFRNTGNPSGSVLSRVPELTRLTGATKVASAGDYTFFYGGSIRHRGVWMIYGTEIKKISTTAIDRALGTASLFSSYISAMRWSGYTWAICPMIMTYGGDTVHFVYCVELGTWTEWHFDGGVFVASQAMPDNITGPFFNHEGNNGKVFYWSPTPVYQDNGSSYEMMVQTSRIDFGTGNRKFLKSIELVADTQSSGTTSLEISKDDFATFSTIGTFDMTKAQKIIYRCGSFDGGASLRLKHSANTAWRGEALVVDYEVGVH
jgi:hypothetical protein